MAWWKYKSLEIKPQDRYDAQIRGWPAFFAALGGLVGVFSYAHAEEEGSSALTVASMVVGFAIAALAFYFDGRDTQYRPGAAARLRARRRRSRGSPPPPA